MAARSSNYWEKRFSTLENSLHRDGLSCYAEIEQQYRRAEHEIEAQMRSWYNRFAENNEISLADAKKWLHGKDLDEFKWTVQDYIKAGEENALDGRWMKQLENASAKYHISRLESLELEMQQSLEVMFGSQLDSLDAAMRKVYTDGYYHTAFEIQKGWGVGWDFAQLDERKINKVIRKPWAADGRDFSERIWENREKLVNELNQTLVQNMVLGQDPQKAIDAIAQKMEVSKRNAGRLVMTEEAYFASVSQADCFRELDVEQYQIIVTFDKETCDTCGDMDGRVFKMSEREVGATAPPFHPNCRCTTIPYFAEWYGLERERAARDENGQTYQVPADMSYKEWQKSIEEGANNENGGFSSESKSAIITGARILDPFSNDADEFAEMYYEEIRHFSTDCQRIAENIGKPESDIKRVKAYIFEDKSLFDSETGEWRRFDPDCAIAQSWQRLMLNDNIQPHDLTLIEHELLEMDIKKNNPDISHLEAHEEASRKFNYNKEAEEYYGNLKKHNKN